MSLNYKIYSGFEEGELLKTEISDNDLAYVVISLCSHFSAVMEKKKDPKVIEAISFIYANTQLPEKYVDYVSLVEKNNLRFFPDIAEHYEEAKIFIAKMSKKRIRVRWSF